MHTHRTSHLEILSLLERKASLTVLLAPVASLVRVANYHILVSVGVKTRVDMHSNLLLIGANIHCKAAAQSNKKAYDILIQLLILKMTKKTPRAQNIETTSAVARLLFSSAHHRFHHSHITEGKLIGSH